VSISWAIPAVLAVVTIGAWWAVRVRRARAARLREARSIAADLLPEVRALVDAARPDSPSAGEPAPAKHYEVLRQRLPRILPREDLFAVETFYQCVESYREARRVMVRAFAVGEDENLGNRIRAKDLRDRCLNDVYYTGDALAQKLEIFLA